MKAISLLTLLVGTASAAKFAAKAKRSTSGVSLNGVMDKHTTALGAEAPSDGEIEIDNYYDVQYSTTITLGGKKYRVLIDTGSSDLWVYSPQDAVVTVNTTDIPASIKYAKGEAAGYIDFADLEFGDYKVPAQSFINVEESSDMDGLFSTGSQGILGLAFDSRSRVNVAIKGAWGEASIAGRPPISNIFHQNPNINNFISVLLGRTDDLDDEVEGQFTIAEYIDEFKQVQNEPKLPRQVIHVENKPVQRWNVEVDGMSLNGQAVKLKSKLGGVKDGSVIALLDTGFSLPPVPVEMADAIYSSIPGASKVKGSEKWVVPCLNSTEVVFKIGGKDFPIHPLDLTIINHTEGPDGKQYTYCTNTFQGSQPSVDLDLILGDAFLKNVYAIFDWGNESDGGNEEPFMQLLSTTTFAEAVPEFLHARAEALKSLPEELPPAQLLALAGYEAETTTSTSVTSGGSEGNETKDKDGKSTSAGTNNFSAAAADNDTKFDDLVSKVGGYGPIIIGLLAANLLFVLVLTAIGVAMCIRRGGKAKTVSNSYAPVKLKDSDNNAGYSTYNTPYNA